MAEILIGALAWGALKLTSSLVSAGFKKLIGVDEDAAMVEWSGDVVLKAREKSHQQQALVSSTRSPDTAPFSRALEGHQHEVRRGLANLGSDLRAGLGALGAAAAVDIAGVRSEVQGVKRDIASVRATVEECRAENMEFFESFTASLEATQQGIEIMRSAPLEEAEMSLKNFEASNGNVRFLETAHSKAMTALVQGHSLDVKLSAAIIAVSAGYVHMSKVDSPSEAKHFTVNGTLSNIVKHFVPIWADPSSIATTEGKKVLSFLLNLVACVCVLPSESVPVLPKLDKRLLPAFGALCAADPELRAMYPVVAGVSVRAMLEAKTMKGLFQLAEEVDVNVDTCTSKGEVVQALLASGKSLVPGSAMKGRALPGPQPVSASVQDATTDRAVLMGLFNATGGPSWKSNTGWGTSAPLGEWHGVTVDGEGRVVELDLWDNSLYGTIPAALAGLTALQKLRLSSNQLSGVIPVELGGLKSLAILSLGRNKLTGPIPAELGGLTALGTLSLKENQLSGTIPGALGGLKSLTWLGLHTNKLTGPIPAELGGLTALETLGLEENQLSGVIPVELGGLKSLTYLALGRNNLTGPIPAELGGLTALETLSLEKNQLSGVIPPELGGLKSLTVLGLSSNNLSGSIPAELGGLTALESLGLQQNQLSGPIPAELGGLTALETLGVEQNLLSGIFPLALGGLESLTWLGLHENKLTGPIPAELGGLTALETLGLEQNQLSGVIPQELGGLKSLTRLTLGRNNLTGPIPAELGGLTSLETLGLEWNELSGPIPTALGGLAALKGLWLNNNHLSGTDEAKVRRMLPNCSSIYV
eukprot:g5942.t1